MMLLSVAFAPFFSSVALADDKPLRMTLADALEFFQRQNLELVAERFQVEASRADVLTAGLLPNPQLSINGTFINPRADQLAGSQFSARLDYLIETAGKRRLRHEAAEAGARAREQQFIDVTRQLIMEVKQAFYSVLLAREHLTLAKENLERFEEILRVNTIRFERGGISEAELIKTRLQKLDFQNDMIAATLELQSAKSDLKGFLALPPTKEIEAVGEMRQRPDFPSLSSLQERALLHRSDFLSQEEQVHQNESQLKLAQAQRTPDFTVGAEYDAIAPDYHPSVGAGISIPLPFFNRNQGEIQKADRMVKSSQTQLEQIRQKVLLEVERAYQEVTQNLSLINAFESGLLRDAQESQGIVENAYQKGGAALLDLLDAERTYNTTRLNYAQALFNAQRGLANLEGAVGEGIFGGNLK
ncbi:MAG: TolC family protein [Nitrospirae bacterium]|nr:TolC family protein [Nitrospirota bacterium]